MTLNARVGRLIAAFSVVLSSAIVLSLPGAAMAGAAKKSLITVKFAVSNPYLTTDLAYLTSVPSLLGYWKQQGLNVEVSALSGTLTATQALASGKEQVIDGGTSSLLAASAAGLKVSAFFTETNKWIWRIAVLASSPITSLSQLAGKPVGDDSISSGTTAITEACLAAAGVPSSQIQMLGIGVGATLGDALQAGKVAAIGSYDSEIAGIEALGIPLRILPCPQANDYGFQSALFTTSAMLKAHPQVLVKLARGIAEAMVFAHANPYESVRMHYEFYPQTVPTGVSRSVAVSEGVTVLEARLQNVVKVGGEWGETPSSGIQPYEKFLVAAGQLSSLQPVSRIWDPSLLKAINDFNPAPIIKKADSYPKS